MAYVLRDHRVSYEHSSRHDSKVKAVAPGRLLRLGTYWSIRPGRIQCVSMLVLAVALCVGCPKEKQNMQTGKTWEEVSGSTTDDVEAKNLERFVEQARSSNARYTVSIFDGSGAHVPVSEWSQHHKRGLNVRLQFDGSQDVVRWVPIDPGNIAILLRE